MKLKLKTNTLKKIINKFNSVIAEFDPISENTGIYIEGFENKIIFKAKNKNISLKTELNVKSDYVGNFLIKSRTLNEAINKINSEDVELIKNKNNSISLKNSKIQYNLNLLNGNFLYYPKDLSKYKKIIELDTEELKKQIKSILFCVSDKNPRTILRSINFRINKDKIVLVASDETKIGFSTNQIDSKTENNFSIHLNVIKDLLKVLDSNEKTEIFLFEDQLILINNNTTIELRVLENDYPDVLRFIPKKFDKEIQIAKKILFEAFNQAMLINSITSSDETPIRFDISNGKIILETQDEGIGNALVQIEEFTSNFNDNFHILFNPKFFVETLKSIEEEDIIIRFNSNDDPFLVNAKENDLHQILILPFGRG